MDTPELFYLEHCPYCHKARRALEELGKEDPAYAGVNIRWIEESREAELAARYDYYYVPSVFWAGKKLYEASPAQGYEEIRESLRGALDTVLGRE